MATEKTILLKGRGHREEGVLDTVATPGMHVQLASDGKYDLSPATSAELVKSMPKLVLDDPLRGKTITDAYAIADRAFLYELQPGDHFLAYVKTGINLVIGDKVVPEGGGSGLWIEAAGTEAVYHCEALESTGGALAAATHVKCRVIR